MRNFTVHTARKPAVFGLAANPTEAREGHAIGGIPEGGRFAHPAAASRQGRTTPSCQSVLPEPFQRAAALSDSLRACRYPVRKVYHLELTEREYLHVHSAVERDRNATYKAIRKGLCHPDDLKGSESLWRKLQDIMARRMGYGRQS
ncbi:MAG TPA: hypothetical protein VFK88_00470 [Gallionella sp.]|nr:hypothetical protein [Gallionella sp.]